MLLNHLGAAVGPRALFPLLPLLQQMRCSVDPCMSAGNRSTDLVISSQLFATELERRGLHTALTELQADGPSAFKDPVKVIEYVMLCLQHQADKDGVNEAFRFTCREPGKSSFVSGMALSAKRVSWRTAKVIGGYVSGATMGLAGFEHEIRSHFHYLCGCATWRFAVLHPTTFEPLCRSASDDFVREYVIVVDERPVVMRLFYDWGAWCYLVYSVEALDEDDNSAGVVRSAELADGSASWATPDDEGGRKRGRGGSL